MDNQTKQRDDLKDNNNPDSNYNSINSSLLHQVDDDQTEELSRDPFPPKIKKNKNFILSSVQWSRFVFSLD